MFIVFFTVFMNIFQYSDFIADSANINDSFIKPVIQLSDFEIPDWLKLIVYQYTLGIYHLFVDCDIDNDHWKYGYN